jgi:hypothetical protein
MQDLIVCNIDLVVACARSLLISLALAAPAPRPGAHEASLILPFCRTMGRVTTWGLVLEPLTPSLGGNYMDGYNIYMV